MTENYNPARPSHRIRTRQAASHPPDWELLQTLLGLAFTIQQEAPKKTAQTDPPAGYGQHPALERIATFAQNLTEASGAAIALGDVSGMICVARSGASAPPVGAEFNAADGLSGECIRLAQPVVCVNASADPRVNYQACRALNIASLLYLPLYSPQKKLIGILGVFSPQPLHFSQRDISCLRPTERLVHEALGATAENPDPTTLGALLQQAGIEASTSAEPMPQAAVAEFEVPLSSLPALELPPVEIPPLRAVPKINNDPPKPKADAIFVGRVVDELAKESEPESAEKKEESEGRSRISVMLVVLVVLLVLSAVYSSRRPGVGRGAKASETAPAQSTAPVADKAPTTVVQPAAHKLTEAVSMVPTDSGVMINIELPKAIRYEGYQLEHPDRIYFDLHDVKLSDVKGSEFKQADGLVSGVRLFSYATGVTRIVFDLRYPANFAAKLDEKPARLTIELKRVGDASKISEANPRNELGLHTGANSP